MRGEPIRIELREPGLVGNLFLPEGEGPFPAVVLLAGPFHSHSLADCYYEMNGTTYFHGGTPEANAAASKEAWPLIIEFLRR